jgi:hypothetical protein
MRYRCANLLSFKGRQTDLWIFHGFPVFAHENDNMDVTFAPPLEELGQSGAHQLLVCADDVNLLSENIDTVKKDRSS